MSNPTDPQTPVSVQVQPRFEARHDIATPIGEIGVSIQLGMPANIGDIVELYKVTPSSDSTLVGKAVVFDGWRGMFADLPGRFFETVDNAEARTYGGLVAALTLQYGAAFNPQAQVTAYHYRRYQ